MLAEGWDVIGFDIERHQYGDEKYPAQLVLQNVLTLHGSQFKDANLIVGSSPCQEFSYRAMPWKRAKALGPPLLGIKLFDAQFRIQREACEAAGRHIPMVVENVRGAQKWVGRSRWNFGSYHLWGDVPALMPMTRSAMKNARGSWFRVSHNNVPHSRGDAIRHTPHMTNPAEHGRKGVGSGAEWFDGNHCRFASGSPARARAQVSKIPLPLARHIARVFLP